MKNIYKVLTVPYKDVNFEKDVLNSFDSSIS